MIVVWAKIDEFEYEVSNCGSVRRINSSKCLKQVFAGPKNTKYFRVTLVDAEGKQRKKLVHRLMLESFIGKEPMLDSCHNDGNTRNNTLSNLRWDTRKNNLADRKIHGTSYEGTRNPKAKLTEEQVIEIKTRLSKEEKVTAIAKDFDVSAGLVSQIKVGRIWNHLTK